MQKIKSAIPPPGNARADWKVLNMIGKKFDEPSFRYTHPREVMSDIARFKQPYSEISYDRLGVLGLTARAES